MGVRTGWYDPFCVTLLMLYPRELGKQLFFFVWNITPEQILVNWQLIDVNLHYKYRAYACIVKLDVPFMS